MKRFWRFGGGEDVAAAVEDLDRSLTREEKEAAVREDFLPKAKALARGLPFVRDLTAAYHCLTDGQTPLPVKAAIVLPLAYFVFPADAVPDILPALGYTDDIAVWGLAFKTFRDHLTPAHYAAADETLGD